MKQIQKDRSDLNWIKYDKSEDIKTEYEWNISEQQRTKHQIKYRLSNKHDRTELNDVFF